MKLKNRVLAVLALALLIINMLPVRVAEAAETIPETITLKWGSGTNEVSTAGYRYYMVLYGDNNEKLFLSNSPLVGKLESDGSILFYVLSPYISSDVKVVGWSSNKGGSIYSPTGNGSNFSSEYTSYNSNYDFKNGDTGALLLSAKPFTIPSEYSFTAPYLKDVTFSNENLYYTAGNSDFDLSRFQFLFDISNNGVEYLNRTVQFSGYVCLPSKEFLEQAKEDFLGGRESFEKYYKVYSGSYYPDWVKTIDIDSSGTFKKWPIKFEVSCGDFLNYSITYNDLFELVEQCNNVDLLEYYDTDRIPYEDFLKCYMWVQRLDGIVYTEYVDSINYGNLTSFIFSGYLKDAVVGVGTSDPFLVGPPVDFVGPMLPDVDVQQNINQAYRDALEQAMKDMELDEDLDLDLEVEDGDLFTSFKKFASGVYGLTGSFKGIALAVGNVFAFFPEEFTLLLYGGIVVMIVIAIIKALRK